MWWPLTRGKSRARGQERELQSQIAEGRYHLAVPVLLDQGRIAEAARLESLRGNSDRAATLYERAGDVRGAASVYLTMGDFEMAALVFKDGELLVEAAQAYIKAGRHETAAALYEEAGLLDQALACWRAKGDAIRVAELLRRLGRGGEAAALQARQAEETGRWPDAAESWENAGELARAVEAWKRAMRYDRAGKLLASQGDWAGAAPLLLQGGLLQEAADAYARIGEHAKAAEATYRAGDTAQTVRLLTEGQEWVPLARICQQLGQDERSREVLAGVTPEYPRFEESRVLLATSLRQAKREKDAYRVFEDLVRRRVESKSIDADVRRWVVQMAEILFRADRQDDAIEVLRKLQGLGLMTAELTYKIEAIERQSEAVEEGEAELVELTGALGLPGTDRYEILSKVGEGGNGVVYRAMDKVLGRELALKMIGQTALPSEVAMKFFIREAQTAAQLNHPNIVTIFDLSELDGRSYITMELIDGESLADILARERGIMDPHELVPVVEQLCAALEYAHDRGVIHRDVKLENVMILSEGGDVKLMDFGLAKPIQGSPDKSIVITGTPLYMSPEQIMGRDTDGRTDIYALGVMLYRIVSGQWPYLDGNILEAHRTAPVPDPLAAKGDLPVGFRSIIEGTMAKNIEDRYARASEVAAAYRHTFG